MIEFKNISILVDYAHEPESLKQVLTTLDEYRKKGLADLIFHVYSATGSGRDTWKRPLMSQVSGDLADIVMITSEDHDVKDDLDEILSELQNQLKSGNRVRQVLVEKDRRLAFRKSLKYIGENFADQKVILVSTAMGSQQSMETAQGIIEWSDREVWLEEWKKFQIEA